MYMTKDSSASIAGLETLKDFIIDPPICQELVRGQQKKGVFTKKTLQYSFDRHVFNVFVTSAGNAGPALSTVGSPGGSLDDVISVGAWVDKDTMEAAHSLIDDVEGTSYTWSSRGPQANGSLGYAIYAPGAAITSVPQYNLYGMRLMNGTSMASPNCAGCVALLVGGLKMEGVEDCTPYRIKSAIVCSGKDVGDPMLVPFVQVYRSFANTFRLKMRGKC
jgi:tripeptidyl-peptidase-2